MNLNHPTIDPGMLSAADLDAARRDNPGSIWHPHRYLMAEPGAIVTDDEAECGWLDSCAPEGGKYREPSAALQSMRRHDRIRYRVALAVVLAVTAYITHLVWPLLA